MQTVTLICKIIHLSGFLFYSMSYADIHNFSSYIMEWKMVCRNMFIVLELDVQLSLNLEGIMEYNNIKIIRMHELGMLKYHILSEYKKQVVSVECNLSALWCIRSICSFSIELIILFFFSKQYIISLFMYLIYL